MAQSAGGWGLTRQESVSTGLRPPLVPPDPDSLAEALLRHDDLKGRRDEQQVDLTIKYWVCKTVILRSHINSKYRRVWGCRTLWRCCLLVFRTSSSRGRTATPSSRLSPSHSTSSLCGHHHPLLRVKIYTIILSKSLYPSRLTRTLDYIWIYLNIECRSELPDHREALVVDVAAHLEVLVQGHRSVVCLVELCA